MSELPGVAAMNHLGHELRRPLTVIRGAATLLLEAAGDMEPDTRDEMLRLIDSGVDDMSEMIEDMLAAVHIQAGDLRLDPEPVAVATLLAEVIGRCRRLDPDRLVEVSAPPAPVLVEADRAYLARALRALVTNALVHAPGSDVRIDVAGAGGGVRVEVADRGPGIAPEHVEEAFTAFGSVPEAMYRGLGVGLFVARGLARAMGGDVGVEPRPGGGSVAWLTLPTGG